MSDGLLLVAHGSRHPAGVAEARQLGEAVATASPDLPVELGFLELAAPTAGAALDGLAARGCTRVTVQPLLLLAAGHGRSDVPAVVLDGRSRHPGVELILGSPLGVVPGLLGTAVRRLEAAGAGGLPLLVVARGTSHPDANAEAARAARLLAEWAGVPDLELAFTGMTWPTVPDALARMARLGHRRVAVFFWFLATGRLVERARGQLSEGHEQLGLDVVDAGYFGPDPAVVSLVLERQAEAVAGRPRINCDTCSYRAEWPGHETRLGQARGVGHSALAAGHLHSHGSADGGHHD